MTHAETGEIERRRGAAARIGIVALNLLGAGIGLLRVGSGRAAVWLFAVTVGWISCVVLLSALAPRPSFSAVLAVLAIAAVLILILYGTAFWLTWRRSVQRAPVRWYGRWYSIILIWIASSVVGDVAVLALHHFYKPFYIPSEAMVPTLKVDDRILADMRPVTHPAIGDIVLVRARNTIYIKRVAALPGDRISIAADIPTVNGVPATAQAIGIREIQAVDGPQQASLFREHLPGEVGSHEIAITTKTDYGDMAEQTVPLGHVFLLGDNRERSADGRFPAADGGLGMTPITDLAGQALYITWSPRYGISGQKLTH